MEKSLFAFHSKREVTENFSLEELLDFTKQRNLQEWFAENFYAAEARKVAAALNDEANDTELKLLICKLFDLSIETLSAADLEEISATVEKNQRRKLFMRKIPGDDRKTAFVETQGELVKALQDEAQLIYLYGGEFRIPLNRRGVTYVGCENALINVDEEFDVDLDACEIVLENLQVYLRHPIAFKAEKSKNVKILDGSKKALLPNVSLKEIFHILRGRRAFELPENFKRRAEDVKGAAVGEALLEDKDYAIDTAQFKFQPRWDFEYISILKDFIADKKFFVKVHSKDVENLYHNERKLQIFADFTYRDGKLTILNLYFDTKTLGRIAIIIASCEEIITSASSGFGLGYGLDIINNYKTASNICEVVTTTVKKIELNKYGRDYTKRGGSVHLAHLAMFVQKASSFKSRIQVQANSKIADGKAILMLYSLGLKEGTKVTIIANGSDAQEAAGALKELIDTNFERIEDEFLSHFEN